MSERKPEPTAQPSELGEKALGTDQRGRRNGGTRTRKAPTLDELDGRTVICHRCDGSGEGQSELSRCLRCGGGGELYRGEENDDE